VLFLSLEFGSSIQLKRLPRGHVIWSMIAARYENSSKPRAAHPFGGLFPSLNSIQFLHHIKKERSMAGKFDPPAVCAKCGGAMEAGLSMNKDMKQLGEDYVFEDNETLVEHWQKVERAAGKFLGRSYEGYKRVGTSLPVLHYRCTDCGYLEAYAPLR
jgi:hypothetical protein